MLIQNDHTCLLGFIFMSLLPRNEITFHLIMNFKEQLINFIAMKHESEDSLQCAVRILYLFPELINTPEDCQFILERIPLNEEYITSQLLVAFIHCFSQEDTESIILFFIEQILDITFSYLKGDDRYPVICAFVQHIPKHSSDVLYSVFSSMLNGDIDSLAGCGELIHYLEFNSDQREKILHDLLSLDHNLLISEDGILAISAAIRKSSIVADEEFEILHQVIHASLDNIETIGPCISILISSLFIKFGDQVKQYSKNCFNHIISIIDHNEFINSRFLKACADIIQSVGPIQEAHETFIHLLYRCQMTSDHIQNIAYSISILISTYFNENIEEQDTYIEFLTHFLKSIQEQYIDDDAFYQICKTLTVCAKYMNSKQTKSLLRGNTLSIIKDRLKYKSSHDISNKVLDMLKSK